MTKVKKLRLAATGLTLSLCAISGSASAHHGDTSHHQSALMMCDAATSACNSLGDLLQAQTQAIDVSVTFGDSALWGNLAGVSTKMAVQPDAGLAAVPALVDDLAVQLQDETGITAAEAAQMLHIVSNQCMPKVGTADALTMRQCPLTVDVDVQMTGERTVMMKFDYAHNQVQFDWSKEGMSAPIAIYRGSFDNMMALFNR